MGYDPWAVTDRNGRLLGHLGLRLLPELAETELLYMLDSAVWGRGLAIEGGFAACEFGLAVLGLPKLIGLALPENVASIRVLERLGMRRSGTVEAFGKNVLRFDMQP